MASISKKKLQKKNKSLSTKLKEKITLKAELKVRLKNAEEAAKYLENEHAKIFEELEGKM